MAACSISRRLVSLLNRSDSSESSSDTTRPEHVGGDRQRELEREQPADAVERAAGEPLAQRVVGRAARRRAAPPRR